MKSNPARPVQIVVGGSERRVSGLLMAPAETRACYVFAHGAGAGMAHPFMQAIAQGLYGAGIATLRYQFPYMENRSRRPDPPALCHTTVRAAVEEAARLLPGVPLIAGGKSFGGRMSSQAQAKSPLPGVLGLAFIGFPLHPPKQPADERAAHLLEVSVSLLFLQGTRDEMAELQLLRGLIARLGERATLHLLQDANHSFQVPARSGRTAAEVIAELIRTLSDWTDSLLPRKA
jgi:uncharacterized protein